MASASFSIAPAQSHEGPAIHDLVCAAFTIYETRIGRQPMPMTFDYTALAEAGKVFVLKSAGALCAMLYIEDDGDALLIDTVATRAQDQGKGYGLALVAKAEAIARQRGYDKLRLYTNALMSENIAFYARHGFRVTACKQVSGFQRVYMERTID